MTAPFGVYVHVPWCRTRCPYCAFAISTVAARPTGAYTDAVLTQWAAERARFAGAPSSLAFGGGTPSLHPPAELARVIRAIAPAPGAEVGLEANPEDIDAALIDALRRAGVTRLSLGMQTFDARSARLLNRAHSVRAAPAKARLVAASGFESWSMDLIFAQPRQSLASWAADLEAALALDPPHLSIYGLAAEEGTPYSRALESGRLRGPPPALWAEMYDLAVERLRAAGLARYEVSNFARPGHRSRHNEHYWRWRPYAGLGMAAHGLRPDGERTATPDTLDAYLVDPLGGERERPPPETAAVDLLLSTLRHVEGVPRDALEALGFSIAQDDLARLSKGDMLRVTPSALLLSGRGWRLADGVVSSLVDGLQPTRST